MHIFTTTLYFTQQRQCCDAVVVEHFDAASSFSNSFTRFVNFVFSFIKDNDDGDVMQGPSVGTSEGIAGTLLGRMFNANIIPRGICCSM